MYTSTTTDNNDPILAWRFEGAESIWFGQRGHNTSANCVTRAEAKQLIAELQHELAAAPLIEGADKAEGLV